MPWKDPNDLRPGSWADFLDMTIGTYKILLPVLFLLLGSIFLVMLLLYIIF
ncbi:MAG: hypothetical protein DK305_001115 [Chloroflexi bacterium]|jgi:hypothetical protein|nr:MAG: hypothetical protein DK305_001115 [Chloroflexota bacterium]